MGTDFDPLDDIFAGEVVKNAKAVGKFRPKAKFQPTKRLAATSVSSSQAAETVDSRQSELDEPLGIAKTSEHCSDVVPSDDRGWRVSVENSVGEMSTVILLYYDGCFSRLMHIFTFFVSQNAEISIGLKTLGDFPPQTSSAMDAIALNVPHPEESTDTCKVADVPTYPGLSEGIDSLTTGEPIVPSSDGREQMHDREEMDAMGSVNMTGLTTKSVNYAEKISVPAFQQDDDVPDFSSLDFTPTFPSETTSELPLNGESLNLMEAAQLDSGIHQGVPEIPAKLVSRRAKTAISNAHIASDSSSQQQEGSPSRQENETGPSLTPRKRKTNFCEFVDEDEVLASVEFSEECPLSTAMVEENINNEEFYLESESQMKKTKRRSEKTDGDEGKPSRKQKKAKEASDQDACVKPKKFSHSTRRRRVVDKVLLETPEDEIDYHKVPLRDLIARAEHQEKQMKKVEAAAGAPVMKQSNGSSSGLYNEDETFISKQGVEYNDEQGSPLAEDTTVFFNYQTYMDKTPSTRWSKQDTELFYEALRQFGTDLSMIQQLFPGRSRRQVLLKYKKEERQHPMRLLDALTNRTKDHSYFEKVIEYLKEVAAEEKENVDEDDTIDLAGNEMADEGTSNADDEEPKDEHIQEDGNNDVAAEEDFIGAQSPSKSDDGEDELFMWSQYKSDT